MIAHKGIRVSFAGILVFMASIALLAVIPDLLPRVGLVAGGGLVFAGLIWTLVDLAAPPPEEPLPPS